MTSEVRQNIDIASLENWIRRTCPKIKTPIASIRQVSHSTDNSLNSKLTDKKFTNGQSNPTYFLTAQDGIRYVLRKKPPKKLLSKKAHWIEREYQVLNCLKNTEIPVPQVYAFCSDESVLGTPFYIMEYLEGRIFETAHLAGVNAEDRREMWVRLLCSVLAIKPSWIFDQGGETWWAF